jgi:hypothetical protein
MAVDPPGKDKFSHGSEPLSALNFGMFQRLALSWLVENAIISQRQKCHSPAIGALRPKQGPCSVPAAAGTASGMKAEFGKQ